MELLNLKEYESYQKLLKEKGEEEKGIKETATINRKLNKGLQWCRQGDKRGRFLR